MSDFHLGFSDDALLQARDAIKKAIDAGCDALIIAGDLFDVRTPRQEVLWDAFLLFGEALRLLEAQLGARGKHLKMHTAHNFLAKDGGGNISEDTNNKLPPAPIIAIAGTHERRPVGFVNAIQLLETAQFVTNANGKSIVIDCNSERIAITGFDGVPEESAAKAMAEAGFRPVDGAFNIFVFHQALRELLPLEGFMSVSDLPTGFDLYVDGHIHWARELVVGGKQLLLPGSTIITQMRENEAYPKGFYVFDTATKKVEFVKIAARPFVLKELFFNDATPSQVETAVRKMLEELVNAHEKPLIKIKLRGTLAKGYGSAEIDTGSLENAFADKALVSIDKEFESTALAESIASLHTLREERMNVRELGLKLLKTNLNKTGSKLNDEDIEFLFELLTIEKDAAEKLLNKLKEK